MRSARARTPAWGDVWMICRRCHRRRFRRGRTRFDGAELVKGAENTASNPRAHNPSTPLPSITTRRRLPRSTTRRDNAAFRAQRIAFKSDQALVPKVVFRIRRKPRANTLSGRAYGDFLTTASTYGSNFYVRVWTLCEHKRTRPRSNKIKIADLKSRSCTVPVTGGMAQYRLHRCTR